MTRTYMPLSILTIVKVGKCTGVLPNKMQCWRAGDVLVTETTPAPTAEDAEAVSKTEYQLCNYHATIQQQQDAKEAADAANLATAQANAAAAQAVADADKQKK